MYKRILLAVCCVLCFLAVFSLGFINKTFASSEPAYADGVEPNKDTKINGYLYWTDDASNNHPLQNVEVKVYDRDYLSVIIQHF